MFWRTQAPPQSNLTQLLEKEDVSLTEVIEDEYVIQEAKCSNKRLIEYLCKPGNLSELLRMALSEPSENRDEKKKYQHATLACELLTTDDDTIVKAVLDSADTQQHLLSFLKSRDTLNPLLGSFYSRILSSLLLKQPQKLLEFLKSSNDWLDNLFHHMDTPALMDILYRFVCCVDNDEQQEAYKKWLFENQLGSRLIALFDPQLSPDVYANAAQLMSELIRQLRENLFQMEEKRNDPLLEQLQSIESLQQLLHRMFQSSNHLMIVYGSEVFFSLLQSGYALNSAVETSRDIAWNPDPEKTAIRALEPALKDFHQVLCNTSASTCAKDDTVFGWPRLCVARLLAAILRHQSSALHDELYRLGTLPALLDCFRKYASNNFLHTAVVQCVQSILEPPCTPVDSGSGDSGPRSPLLLQLLHECNLIQLILGTHEQRLQTDPAQRLRLHYYGHVMQMANALQRAITEGPMADVIARELSGLALVDLSVRWKAFAEEVLTEYNKANEPDSIASQTAREVNVEIIDREEDFPLSTLQQFGQVQKSTSEFSDKFGFSGDEFTTATDANFDALKATTGDIMAQDFGQSNKVDAEEAFEALCSRRVNQNFMDTEEDPWEEKQITFDNRATDSTWSSKPAVKQRYSGSSDDEEHDMDFETKDGEWPCESEGGTSASVGWATFDMEPKNRAGAENDWANFEQAERSQTYAVDPPSSS